MNIWRLAVPSAGQGTKTPELFIASTGMNFNPRYSPDGSRILFSSRRSGFLEIWTCDSDGTNPRQLTFLEHGQTWHAEWSPGGKQVAFWSSKEGSFDIYVVGRNWGYSAAADDGDVGRVLPELVERRSFDLLHPPIGLDGTRYGRCPPRVAKRSR